MDTTSTSPQFLTPEELAEDEAAALKAKRAQKKIQEKAIVDRLTNQILCQDNPRLQAAELVMCENDILYFINNFVFTYDPREPFGEQDIPMLTYDYQNDFIGWLCHHIDATVNGIAKRTMLVEKSRDMGASWVLVAVAVHYWLFKGGSVHFGSRTYDEADMLGDMGSLVEKVRFVIRRLPRWMWPVGFDPGKDMSFANIKNPASNNQITAEAASPEFCRGDRKTFVVMDEYASWDNDEAALKAVQGGSTNALILISTPKGPFNKFAKLANDEDKVQVEKYRIHWTQHPVKSAGQRSLEGKPTSYWYRQQCAAMTAEDIASELDIKYETSTKGLIFDDYQEIHRGHNLSPIGSGRIIRIQDPGVHWFVLFAQVDPYGRLLVLDEHYDEQAYVGDIAWAVKEKSQRWKGYGFDDCGDPNGENRQAGSQELSDYDVMREEHDIDPDTSMFDG
ncbi:MAG: hypothetical protein P4L61_00250, partial [Candidatus Pacebacteria bacterium]|nr:hypothetical protein [Candidatus Paceibacterota bacterium]